MRTRIVSVEGMSAEDATSDCKNFGFMPSEGLIVLTGHPGAGKSTMALQMAFALSANLTFAGGRNWFGEPLVGAYVALERARLVRRHAFALKRYHQVDEVPLVVCEAELSLLDEASCRRLSQELKRTTGMCDFLVLDTLSRGLSGHDENSAPVMTGALEALERIRRDVCGETGVVIVVAHPAKGANAWPRGHSSLVGGADQVLTITKTRTRRRLAVLKENDGPETFCMDFDAVQRTVTAPDYAGDDMSISFVDMVALESRSDARPATASGELRGLPKTLWEALAPLIGGRGSCSLDAAKKAVEHALQSVSPRYRASRFRDALDTLARRGLLVIRGDTVSVPTAPSTENTEPPSKDGGVFGAFVGANGDAPPHRERCNSVLVGAVGAEAA